MTLQRVVVVTGTDDVGSDDVQKDERHCLASEVDSETGDICLTFSSRLAMYDFVKSLLQEALFGQSGQHTGSCIWSERTARIFTAGFRRKGSGIKWSKDDRR